MMRHLGIAFVAGLAAACTVGGEDPTGDDTAADDSAGDDSTVGDDSSSGDDDSSVNCLVPSSTGDLGAIAATAAEIHNQSGSMGTLKTYVIYADNAGDTFQVELWDQTGAFSGGTAATGTYTLSGVDADYNTCGVCGLAIGDGTQHYIGTAGTVDVTALGAAGATMTVDLTNLSFSEIDDATGELKSGGCTGTLSHLNLTGTLVQVSGGGDGDGGGGGGGGRTPLRSR